MAENENNQLDSCMQQTVDLIPHRRDGTFLWVCLEKTEKVFVTQEVSHSRAKDDSNKW